MKDQMKLKGSVVIEKNGEVVLRKDNLVVSVGKDQVAGLIFGNRTGICSQMAVGTNNTTPAVGQTALVAAVAGSQGGFDSGFPTAPSAGMVSVKRTFGPGVGTGNLQEAGLFFGSTPMLSRVIFTAIPKGAGDTVAITWNITVQ